MQRTNLTKMDLRFRGSKVIPNQPYELDLPKYGRDKMD